MTLPQKKCDLLETFWTYVISSLPQIKRKKKEWHDKEREKLDQNMDHWREIIRSCEDSRTRTTTTAEPDEQEADTLIEDTDTNDESLALSLHKKNNVWRHQRSLPNPSPMEILSTGAVATLDANTQSKRKKVSAGRLVSLKKSKRTKTTIRDADSSTSIYMPYSERKLYADETRKEFEEEKEKVLNDLDDDYVARFGTIVFCCWAKRYRPAVVVSPFDVEPNSQMREDWMKMYKKVSLNMYDAVVPFLFFLLGGTHFTNLNTLTSIPSDVFAVSVDQRLPEGSMVHSLLVWKSKARIFIHIQIASRHHSLVYRC